MVFGAEAIDNRFECTCSIAAYCFLSIRSWLIYNLYACTRIQLEDRHRYICFGEYVQFYILHRSRMYLTEILMLFIEYFSVVRRTFYRVYPLELYVIGWVFIFVGIISLCLTHTSTCKNANAPTISAKCTDSHKMCGTSKNVAIGQITFYSITWNRCGLRMWRIFDFNFDFYEKWKLYFDKPQTGREICGEPNFVDTKWCSIEPILSVRMFSRRMNSMRYTAAAAMGKKPFSSKLYA